MQILSGMCGKKKAFWSWSVIGNQFLSMGDLNNLTFMKIFKSLVHRIFEARGSRPTEINFVLQV